MRIILSGGGTGGHVYPALAIAEELQKRNIKDILYVGREKGIERELAEKFGLEFEGIEVKGLPRKKLDVKNFSSAYALFRGLSRSKKIIKRFKPDVVIGTGGYVCAPIVMKATSLGVRTYLQEQNAYPGKANRFLSKKSNGVFLNFPEAKKYFEGVSCYETGNPIRAKFKELDKLDSRKKLNLRPDLKVVFSFGGSSGQESTNKAIRELIKRDFDFQLIHVTGKENYDEFMKDLKLKENVRILDYCHEVPEYLSASDAVIASSSAMTLAEISFVGRASILIPKAYTAGNHQYYNAMAYKDKKASFVIEEKDLDENLLLEKIDEILKPENLKEFSENSRQFSKPDAAKEIVDHIING